MRRAAISFAAAASVVGVVAACSEDGDTIQGGASVPGIGSPVVRFAPRCGSPGDVVTIRVGKKSDNNSDATCTAEDQYTSFFSPSVESKPSSVEGDAEDCKLTALVPPGATTGKIRLTRKHRNFTDVINHESDDVFTIPCPSDAGPDAESDAEPSVTAPLGGTLAVVNRPGDGVAYVEATMVAAPTNDAQRRALLFDEFIHSLALSPFGVLPGTCGTATPPPGPEPAPEDSPPTISVGNIALQSGAAALLTMPPETDRSGRTAYRGSIPAPVDDAVLSLLLAGGSGVPASTFVDAVRLPPSFAISSPDVSSGSITVPAADLAFTYPALPNALMRLQLQRLPDGEPIACVFEPGAGAFTVPAARLGGAGTLIATMNVGYVNAVTKDERRYLISSRAEINFSIKVQ